MTLKISVTGKTAYIGISYLRKDRERVFLDGWKDDPVFIRTQDTAVTWDI